MSFYRDTETLYAVMEDLFGRVMADPQMQRLLRKSKAIIRITLTNPDAVLCLNARQEPLRFTTGCVDDGKADLGLRIPAQVLHDIWLSNIRMRDAFATGAIHLQTNPLRALGLLNQLQELFRYAEKIYPFVLRERGLIETI